jgi:manganese-dependent inorganic pyrophosphatase
MHKIFVFGHKNPDTDAICSTIAYAEYKTKKGCEACGCRLGDLSNETKFVLRFFGAEEPEMLKTIKTQVLDLEIDPPISVGPGISLKKAWAAMRENNRKALTVVDADGKLTGIVTLSDITRNYMDVQDENVLQNTHTPLANILETLDAALVSGREADFAPTGRVLVAAMDREGFAAYASKGDIVITGNRDDLVLAAIENGANVIVCTCGAKPGDGVLEAARKKKCIVISAPGDTFSVARLIHQSVPVCHVMTQGNIVKFGIEDFVDDIREKMLKTRFRSYPVLDGEGNVQGMVARYHLISRNRKQAVLLDHNERSQTAPGIEDAEIIEIIDHHRLGDIQTNSPILMQNEPVGSTSTIIAKKYLKERELLSQTTAGLLLAGIISDTLKFLSPTATKEDIDTAAALAGIAEVDIDEFAQKLFNAGANLKGRSVDDIINADLKEYSMGKYKIGLSQVYSMNAESLEDFKETLPERMEYYCGKNGFALLMLLVTDLYRNGSEVIFTGDRKDIAIKAFGLPEGAVSAFLPGVLSRKKQVVPKIMAVEEEF